MKKLLVPVCLLLGIITLCGCHSEKDEPYNRNSKAAEYERNFRRYVFASCQNSDQFYSTYALAHLDAKPTDCDPRYKVTFVNGPCKGNTLYTEDVIEKTAPIDGGLLVKGDVVLRNYWNPKELDTETDHLDRWNRGVVYDTSRINQGVVELEFPRDSNDFMAAREFVYVQNVRYIKKPTQKDPRIWL